MLSGSKAGRVTGKIHGTRRAKVFAPMVLTAMASSGLLISRASATNGVWSNNATSGGLWNVTTNWAGGNVASGTGAIATFNVPGVANTVHMDLPYTLGGIAFNNSSTSLGWTIDSNTSSSNILTLATSVGVPTITTTTSGSTSIITAPLAGTQGFNFSGAGNLQLSSTTSTISGPVNVVSAAAGGTYLQDYSTATLANATSLYMTAGTSGTSGMQFLGGVTVPSTVTATFNMNSGGRVDFDSVGSGTATFNNSIGFTNGNSGQITELQMEGSNMTFNGNVNVTNYANANFQLRAFAASDAGVFTFNGNLTLPNGVTLLMNQDGGFHSVCVLNGTANSFTLFGETYGIIKAGVNGALPAASVYSDATAAAATYCYLDLFGTNQTITGLNENQNGVYIIASSSNTSNAVLTLNNSTGNVYNYRGTIIDTMTTQGIVGTKTVALALQQGNQILSGADTYSGGTTITGGTLSLNNSSALGTGFVTVTGPGTMNNMSGVYVSTKNLTLNGATITANNGSNGTSNGAYGLLGTVTIGGTAASSIAAGTGPNNYVQIGNTSSGSTTTFNVGTTGAAGADFTVNVPIANYQSGTGFTSVANLLKTGTGTMRVTGSNTYTGSTTINNGTFQLSSGASISKSTVINVGSAGIFDTSLTNGYTTLSTQTLEGTGTIVGLVNHSAGAIVPGILNGTGGNLNFSTGLFLNGGALDFNLTSSAVNASNSQITVATASGLTNNVPLTPLNVVFSPQPTGSVAYTLFNYSGTLNGSWLTSNFTITDNAGRDILAIDTSTPGAVNLDVTAAPATLYWASTSGAAWDIQTSKNWNNTTTPALNPDYFYNGDAVNFNDGSGLITNITLNVAVQPSSVTVSSNTNNYNFSGSGKITGITGLNMTGNSYLTLATNNDYTGVTNISSGSGTLDVGGSTAVGSLGSGNVLNSGTLVFSRSDGTSATPVTVANNISGAGVTVFTGTGTTTLTGPITQASVFVNTSTGTLNVTNSLNASSGVTVNGGTMAMTGPYSGTGGITVNNVGTLFLQGTNTFTGAIIVDSGYLIPNNSNAFGGTTAPVTVNSGGEISVATSNGYYGTYPIIINGVGPSTNGAIHAGFNSPQTFGGTITVQSDSLLNVDGGATLILSNATALQSFTNANVSTGGSGSVTLNGNLNLGTGTFNNNTFAGTYLSFNITTNPVINVYSTIAGTGQVNVNGLGGTSGQVNFLVDNTYSGNTTINSGILAINTSNGLGTAGSSSGGYTYIVGGGATLDELQLSGNITVGEYFILGGKQPGAPGTDAHIRSVSGNNTLTGAIVTGANGNQYTLQSDSGLFNISGGYTQNNGGPRFLNLQGAGNGLFSSVISNGSGADVVINKLGTGTWTLGVANSYAGPTNVAAGTLVIAAPGALPNFTGVNVTGGVLRAATYTGTKNSLFVNSLSLAGGTGAWVGTVDLTNNDMVVRNGSIGTITNQVAQGYNGGAWNGGGGILSSTAASDSTHLTALGVIQNTFDGSTTGSALISTFDAVGVGNNDVLVKYTYYGDTDLNGEIDGTDYSRIDVAYSNNSNPAVTAVGGYLTGWFNGDFNYDNVVNGSDYTLIDNAFNTQGTQISAQIATPTALLGGAGGGSAVPEPTSLALLGIGAIGLLGRRRSQRN